MTIHLDENAIRAHAEEIAGKASKRKSRKIWALAPLGVLAAGGAAFAAVQLFGYGSIDQGAATMKDLTTSNVKLTGSLVPGQSVGGTADVTNDNDFPVSVTAIVLQDSSLQATGSGCIASTVTPGGNPVTYPGSAGGAGHQIALPAAVAIPAHSARTITASDVVSQAASADHLCGVKANFAIVAQVGN
jgi:hypothetical protein